MPRRASQRRNSHGDQFPGAHQTTDGELHGAEPTSDPALRSLTAAIPGLVRGGPPTSKVPSNYTLEQLYAKAVVVNNDSMAIKLINNSNILFPIARKVNTSYVLFVFFCLKCVERKGFSPFLSYDV